MAERRAELHALVEPMGIALGATGTHPWADWKEQRIIDTPHYRRNDELLRYVVWRNNTFGLHVHIGIRGADRAIAVHDGLRALLPEVLALSASSPFVDDVDTGLHSARTQIFTRFFPRCGVPDAYGDWGGFERYVRFLYATGSMTEHTQLWWSVRPHLAFPTVEIRICDGQPELGGSAGARGIRRLARGSDRPCPRRGRAAAGSAAPADRGEHVAGDPLGHVGRADRLRARRARAGAGATRVLARLGLAGRRGDRRRAVPGAPGAERGRAPDRPCRRGRLAARDLCRAGRSGGADRWLTSRASEELLDALGRLQVGDLLVQTLVTISSLGFASLEAGDGRDLEQARLAIEALRALAPLLEGRRRRGAAA